MMPIETEFQLINLDSEEVLAALNWMPVQRAFLQNLLGEAAHAKLNLKIDPNNMMQYMQEEAYIAAKIDLLRYLLTPAAPTEVPQ